VNVNAWIETTSVNPNRYEIMVAAHGGAAVPVTPDIARDIARYLDIGDLAKLADVTATLTIRDETIELDDIDAVELARRLRILASIVDPAAS